MKARFSGRPAGMVISLLALATAGVIGYELGGMTMAIVLVLMILVILLV